MPLEATADHARPTLPAQHPARRGVSLMACHTIALSSTRLVRRYARLYNAQAPPKGVDFLQAFVMEVERHGETMTFAVERAMEEEGCFVKYNNNSGFVDYGGSTAHQHHMAHRLTPHAFTRFTFDRSAGALMVVDIQGCDDVYTDPQVWKAPEARRVE